MAAAYVIRDGVRDAQDISAKDAKTTSPHFITREAAMNPFVDAGQFITSSKEIESASMNKTISVTLENAHFSRTLVHTESS